MVKNIFFKKMTLVMMMLMVDLAIVGCSSMKDFFSDDSGMPYNYQPASKSKSTSNSSNYTANVSKAIDDVRLVVDGSGKSKDEATKVALRSAIEQTYGTFVSSNTKLLNDELVKDEIVTVSSGYVKSYKIISESERNGRYYVTVDGIISIGKLISYVKSKGAEAELAGATFAMNIQNEVMHRDKEKTALINLGKLLRTMFFNSFDYELNISEPKFFYGDYRVYINVTVKANKNAEACYQLYHKTLSALSPYARGKGLEIICGTKKYYSLNGYYALDKIEDDMKDVICNFTLSDGSHEYVGSYDNHDKEIKLLNPRTKYVIKCDQIKWQRGPISVEAPKSAFHEWPYFLPNLANSNYAGNIIATFKFYLLYNLDELSKISSFKIYPNNTKE